MLQGLKDFIKKIIPALVLEPALSAYHFSLSWLSALVHGYPARRLLVIGITGTKGKTSVAEMLNAISEEAGYTTALLDSIRIKVGKRSKRNTGRSMPGRFFIQNFLSRAVQEQCSVAILEMTSEGARQHRHRYIDLDALVFTNLAPEHIESHGSVEAYADAKYEIGKQLARSKKRPRIMVANADDRESGRYLTLPVEHALPFSLSGCEPWSADEEQGSFTFEDTRITVKLPGVFSLNNAIAATTIARALDIQTDTIAHALESMTRIPGRAERISAGQDFLVVVDYAHTPDSLRALYEAYAARKKICVLSATGGGRDTWKRPVMGRIADEYCAVTILTDEDPYDEDPRQIMEDVAHGMTATKPEIIMDRRAAIRRAIECARTGDAVLISGKGTDAYIHGAQGKNTPWDDARVAREELASVLKARV